MEDYYRHHYTAYHEKTFHIDPSSFLEPLVRHLKAGDTVLDVGCGSGRDLCWLKAHGFNVTGFERSTGLAILARKRAGCEIIEGDFEVFDFSTLNVDAILLSGALVHVTHDRFEAVFENIVSGLKGGGTLLVSLKQGYGSSTDADGRQFYFWQDLDLQDIFKRHAFRRIDFHMDVSKVNEKDIWLSYILKKGSKSPRVQGSEV